MEIQRDFFTILNSCGKFYAAENNSNAAIEFFMLSIKIAERLAANDPSDSDTPVDLANIQLQLGDAWLIRKQGESNLGLPREPSGR